MNREELRKLLGGYATGNLSEAERGAIFAAALEDQELFDALAREQPLADLLEDPAARVRLLAVLEEAEAPRRRPLWFALAAGAAVAAVALVVLLPHPGRHEEAKPAAPRPMLARSSYVPGAEDLLRSTVLRRMPDGSYEPAAAGLRARDLVRLRIEPARAGNLQVLEREGQNWRPVFSGKVEAGRAYFVPGEGNLHLDQPGRREFFLSVTGQPPLSKHVVLDVR